MNFWHIAGSVCLILFAVRLLRKGLDRLFGYKLIQWLQHTTQNRFKAFAAGVVTGTFAPSSTALSFVAVQMLEVNHVSAQRMLAVLLGANVGITITVQLLALNIQDYATILILAGVVCFQFSRRKTLRGAGQCILALGLMFLGMGLLINAGRQASSAKDIQTLLMIMQGHPWLMIIFSAILAFLLQSSTATIGLGIALAMAGLLNPSILLSVVLGANVGIGITTLTAGWSQLESRRLALANLIPKIILTIFLIPFYPILEEALYKLSPSIPRQIADFHTLFNLFLAICALPFLKQLYQISKVAFPDVKTLGGLAGTESYLDPQALESPSLALVQATRETIRMADEVKKMLNIAWAAQENKDVELVRSSQAHDTRIDKIHNSLRDYLRSISESNLSKEESQWQFAILSFSSNLEAVGDIIEKNLCDEILKQTKDSFPLNTEELNYLREIYKAIVQRLDVAIQLLMTKNKELAKNFLEERSKIKERIREIQALYYRTILNKESTETIAASHLLDMLGTLQRINGHITTIGFAFRE